MKTTCQPYADALLDEAALKPSDLGQHLASCATCQALRRGHRGAQLLLGSALPPPPRIRGGPVIRRAAVVLGVVALAAISLFFLSDGPVAPLAEAPRESPPARLEAPAPKSPQEVEVALEQPPLRATPLEADAQRPRSPPPSESDERRPLVELAELSRTVTRYARANPVAHGFGSRWKSLPVLLAPSRSLHPVVLDQEQ